MLTLSPQLNQFDGFENLPQTSLIICSRNRPQLLNELVESILAGEATPTEMIIIDDSDQVNQFLQILKVEQNCDLRYIWNRSVGLSRANNTGIAAANYELLVFTQDDVLVSPSWFRVIVDALVRAGPRSVITGRILPGETDKPDGFAPSTIADIAPQVHQGRIGTDVLYAQNMAFYRSVVDEIGGFDPDIGPGTAFPTAEDNDFGFRLLEAGYSIIYEPRAVTYHRPWRGQEEYLPTSWNYGRGQGAYYAKYLSIRDPYMLGRLSKNIGYITLRSFVRLFYKQKQAVGDIVYLAGLISGVIQWLITHVKILNR